MPSFGRALTVIVVSLLPLASTSDCCAVDRPPNFVLLFCDNLGYGDVGCFGSTLHRTPHIDRIAAEGIRFTDFYSASGVCTPSRAALMTGCYPRRVSMANPKGDGAVLRPVSANGLHPDEVTIAEVLKSRGYATACIGKWHLGDQLMFLPTRQGFDHFFGIPYSDDMTPREGRPWPPLPLMRGEEVVEAPANRDTLTKRYTEDAIAFMNEHRDEPFFVYLPHAMPGSTREPFASDAFRGKSANGAFGDSVEEIDWSTGQILDAIARLGLDEQTLVIWTSDNGAPRRNPPQGRNLPLGGWGYTVMEGGQRVPMVARWPGRIPKGAVCREMSSLMDLLPTFALLSGAELSADLPIDGKNILDLFAAKAGAKSPHEAFFYYYRDQLQAVRSGPWKLHLKLKARQINLQGKSSNGQKRLYHLDDDISESNNIVKEHPEIVARLEALAHAARDELGDVGHPGRGQRPHGRVENPTPRTLTASH